MPELPDPLEGYHFRPGRRGPRTTLKSEMVPVIAEWLARTGVLRIAAAKAGTTEDCLGKWLSRGKDAAARRKSSIYTELLTACEEAWAHRFAHLIELGERTVTDRHMNPRFVTWLMSVTGPKHFTVPREQAAQVQGNGLGPAFELVTPEAAAASVHAKLMRFLEEDDKRNGTEPPAPAEPSPASADSPAEEPEESR
ncbi:hypothetical protein [Archangium minus]|uniref:hypothetical protein n=1 Tax=Archangium minus TaxID=83450 RepID=UPI0037C00E57